MAHLIQSLINPDLKHPTIPYKSAQLICKKIRPDILDNTKLLISICYISLYFNNLGLAFYNLLKEVDVNDNGVELYKMVISV